MFPSCPPGCAREDAAPGVCASGVERASGVHGTFSTAVCGHERRGSTLRPEGRSVGSVTCTHSIRSKRRVLGSVDEGSRLHSDSHRSSERDQWSSTQTETGVPTRNDRGDGGCALSWCTSPVDITKRPHVRADSIGKRHARPLVTRVGRPVSVHIPRTSRSHRVRRA